MTNFKRRVISTAISIIMLFTLLAGIGPSVVLANNTGSEDVKEALLQKLQGKVDSSDIYNNIDKLEKDKENLGLEKEGNPEERIRVIVELQERPATLKLEDGIQPDKKLIDEVKEAQKPIQEEAENKTGEEVRHTYGNLINGFSMDLKRKDIEKVEEIEGIKSVSEARIYYPDMSTAKEFTQATTVWQDYGYKGEGLVVSVIDTGIDYKHKDMKLTDASKAKIKEADVNEEIGNFFSDKVPYGYNFADGDNKVIDSSGSMHGMHVAGIVGANANDEEVNGNVGIQGVSPESQLLAMKVFSNNSEIRGAYSDDIIAAIEKSVELNADIINMSLGSSAGYRNEVAPEQVAIRNATDDGVICVVSAGNSTTSTAPYIIDGISDVGVVGSPGLAKDALQVASSENSSITLPALTGNIDGKEVIIGYTQADVEPLNIFKADEKLSLVFVNKGTVSDYSGKDLKGKVALIERGDISFAEKQIFAQDAGAVAAVIFNTTPDEYINMATDPSVTIPSIFINGSDGNLLKDNVDKVYINFNDKVAVKENSAAEAMSEFTSFGPAPNLEFAPQITGPGGNIYSTLNDDRYGSMSGTSMAAPHVAGATALIIEGLKDKGITLQGRELVEFVKKSIINTAKPLYEFTPVREEIPYSPRRQGAGILQAKSAIDNRVLAVGKDNEATISLKEIGEKTEFEINLKNYSNRDEKYKVKSLGEVLTAFEPSMIGGPVLGGYTDFDVILDGASLDFSADNITVPANGEAKVKVTLNIPSGSVSNNFVEGFINFEAVNEATPSLVVPYMGYYGDWSEEQIIDGAAWDSDNVYMVPSFAATKILGEYNYLGFDGKSSSGIIINPDKIAISPNDDEVFDSLTPALYLLRNAKEVNVDLLDENKNLIQEKINGDIELRKKIFSSENGDIPSLLEGLSWDGKVYNKSTGNKEVAKEGQYYLNYKTKVDGTDTFQDFIIPVKVDITPIKTTLESSASPDSGNYELKIGFNGELKANKVEDLVLFINGKEVTEYSLNEDSLSSNLTLNKDSVNIVEVSALDIAGNISYDKYEIVTSDIKPEVTVVDFPIGEALNNNELLVKGEYKGNVKEILVNGELVDKMEDGIFEKNIILNEGYNDVRVQARSSTGELLFDKVYKTFCDTVAPEINIFEPIVNDKGEAITSKDIIKLKGEVSDNTEGYKLFVNGEYKFSVSLDGAKGKEDTLRDFEYDVKVKNGDIITVKAIDLLGNESSKKIKVIVDRSIPEIEIAGVSNAKVYNKNLKPSVVVTPDNAKVTVTLNGSPYSFEEITAEGNYLLEVVAVGENGVEAKKSISFAIDKTAPIIQVAGVENGKHYNSNISPKVTADEEANINLLISYEGREWAAYNSETLIDEGNYILKARAVDKAGNESVLEYKFTIDKTAPVITIDGIVNGMKYDKEVKAVIKSSEEGEIKATINDNPYNGEVIIEDGEYIIKVVAKDLAGNTSEKSVKFSIKLPDSVIIKPNPTPKPTPKPDPKPGIGGDKVTDENGGEDTNNTLELGKGNLPKTGSENYYYLIVIAIGTLVVGTVFILKKKKVEENKN
ncbi:S8 family serine peptidase [Clostridium sp.]|uniref:S8 family serine peptidase n=1 Tax=Clostridium sp. TaxID=1506 RepID=UPI001DDFC74E|nr:S8 family serine peptidase [Clostridium sp.]MBS5936898.1 S8 family serine peptidase [Clostridium sp.]